jgi:uncharacterized protein DUF3618
MSEDGGSAEPTEINKLDTSKPDAVRADLEATRDELADTVNTLGRKLDMKTRARDTVSQGTSKVSDVVGRARQSMPPNIRRAVDQAAAKTKPIIQRVSERATPYRAKLIAGLISSTVIVWAVANRRSHARGQADKSYRRSRPNYDRCGNHNRGRRG